MSHSSTVICSNCGSACDSTDIFCGRCSYKLVGSGGSHPTVSNQQPQQDSTTRIANDPLDATQPGFPPFPPRVYPPPETRPQNKIRLKLLAVLTVVLLIGIGILVGVQLKPKISSSTPSPTPPTIRNSPTSTPTPTPQELYNQVTNTEPVLSDPLSKNDNNNWDEGTSSSGSSCSFISSAYHASTQQNTGASVNCTAHATNFSTFIYQVQMTFLKNENGQDGIFFRADAANCKYYYFFITPQGNYALYKSEGCGSSYHDQLLLPGSSLPLTRYIFTGLNKSNLLAVMVRGPNINLFVNNVYLAEASDPTYSSGEIGVLALNNNQGFTEVEFRNVKIWKL